MFCLTHRQKRIVCLLVIVVCFALPVCSCSCINLPKTFTKSILPNEIIFSGIILEHIVVPNDSDHLLLYHGLTKIMVTKWYQNEMESDTVYFANGMSSMCITSIERLDIGDHMVFKTQREQLDEVCEFIGRIDEKCKRFVEAYSLFPIVANGICDVNIVKIEQDKVVGNITKNYQARKWRFRRFVTKISQAWGDKVKGKILRGERKIQSMTIDEFDRLMRRKCD